MKELLLKLEKLCEENKKYSLSISLHNVDLADKPEHWEYKTFLIDEGVEIRTINSQGVFRVTAFLKN